MCQKTSTLATQGNVTSRLAAILNEPEETDADEMVELTLDEELKNLFQSKFLLITWPTKMKLLLAS